MTFEDRLAHDKDVTVKQDGRTMKLNTLSTEFASAGIVFPPVGWKGDLFLPKPEVAATSLISPKKRKSEFGTSSPIRRKTLSAALVARIQEKKNAEKK